jgi:hypothetical protein
MPNRSGRAIYVVIEPDPRKRDRIAIELQRLNPLQILFFETEKQARAFLAAVPIEPGVKVRLAAYGIENKPPTLH